MGLFKKIKEAWLASMSFDNLDDAFYEELEEALILADVGVETASDAVQQLRKRVYQKLLTRADEVKEALRDILAEKLDVGETALNLSTQPSVILVIGVNGVGKTTTIGKLAKRLKSELDWVRSSPKARQAKNKARLERYDQMEQEARNNKKLDFSEIQIPAGPRLGSTVLEAEHIHKAFGDRVLIDDLSFTLPRNGIVGVIGPNGVGKSTLFKTIVGLEPLTSGSLKIGETVQISYVDQNRAGLDPNKNLWEAVSDGLDFIEVAGVEVPTRAYVASFGFKGSDQQKLTGVLSGGERNRLNLALTLKQGGNLLLLDEPTNDLDVETLESLENALLGFPGCAVVISHDRWFLDRVATHILAWEGDDENPAKWYWFEGNFQAYQENRVARLGEDAARPHRLHRKLTR